MAITTMTIDHLGAILYPDHVVLRIIGRLTLPIICYLIILGVESTRNVRNYFTRLLLFAIISQVPFYLALGYEPFESLNIFFTLSFAVLFLSKPILGLLLVLLLVFASVFVNFDYGVYAIALTACMRILRENIKFGIVLIVLFGVLSLLLSTIQTFFLLALPVILLYEKGYLKIGGEVGGSTNYPAWRKCFFYVYYPLHLTVLYLIKLSFF